MYEALFDQMKKQLGQVELWIDRAVSFAQEKSFDPDLFLQFRLAPDQFSWVRQVQVACDTARLGAARLTGKELPQVEDNEKSIDELRARVRLTIQALDGFSSQDFAGAKTRTISQPRWKGKTMTGEDYFIEHVVPNFFFHLSHAYAILRHNGVPLGKRDYLGALSQRDPA